MPPPLFYESEAMQKPFDVSAMLSEIIADGEEHRDDNVRDEVAYAPPRARAGNSSPAGGNGSALDRRSFEQGHTNVAAAVPEARDQEEVPEDAINPSHYRKHPSGIECIEVTRHLNFNIGNAIKYLWRCMDKHVDPVIDLKKAQWYIDDEIRRLEGKR